MDKIRPIICSEEDLGSIEDSIDEHEKIRLPKNDRKLRNLRSEKLEKFKQDAKKLAVLFNSPDLIPAILANRGIHHLTSTSSPFTNFTSSLSTRTTLTSTLTLQQDTYLSLQSSISKMSSREPLATYSYTSKSSKTARCADVCVLRQKSLDLDEKLVKISEIFENFQKNFEIFEFFEHFSLIFGHKCRDAGQFARFVRSLVSHPQHRKKSGNRYEEQRKEKEMLEREGREIEEEEEEDWGVGMVGSPDSSIGEGLA